MFALVNPVCFVLSATFVAYVLKSIKSLLFGYIWRVSSLTGFLPVLCTFCSDVERGLFDDDVATAHASVSSSGHVTVDVTVDTCTAACVSDVLYFPFDRWHCSVDLSADDHLQLTANHTHYLAR